MKRTIQILWLCLAVIFLVLFYFHIKSESVVVYKDTHGFYKVNKITGKIQTFPTGETCNWQWRTITK